MRKGNRSKAKPARKDINNELNQYYLKEILRNIENIQTTILKKLNTAQDQCHSPETEATVPQTPTRRDKKARSVTGGKEGDDNYSLQTTPKRPKKASGKEGKPQQFDSYIKINPEELNVEAFKKLNQTPNIFHHKHTNHFSARQEIPLSRSKDMQVGNYYTVRLKEATPSNKENNYRSISKTERGIDRQFNINTQTEQINEISASSQLMATTKDNIISPPTDQIQQFYKKEIEKLQIQQKIRQLQEQLQRCLASKKAANLCEFQFLRSKMKKISVQINQMKEKKLKLLTQKVT